MSSAGYSGKPLVAKLGIRSGDSVAFVGAPPGYRKLLGPLPERVRIVSPDSDDLDCVQVFVRSQGELREQLQDLRRRIKPTGMMWISWPKQTSGLATDLTETQVREVALDAGLVDVKVAAIDATWSGLKLVVRAKDRA